MAALCCISVIFTVLCVCLCSMDDLCEMIMEYGKLVTCLHPKRSFFIRLRISDKYRVLDPQRCTGVYVLRSYWLFSFEF